MIALHFSKERQVSSVTLKRLKPLCKDHCIPCMPGTPKQDLLSSLGQVLFENVVKCKNNEELTTYDNLVTIDLLTGTNLSCAIELCLHVTNIIKTRVQIRYNLTAFISHLTQYTHTFLLMRLILLRWVYYFGCINHHRIPLHNVLSTKF